MNIAIFTDGFYPQISGVTTALINHIKGLTKRGHNVLVFAPKFKSLKNEISIKNTKIIRVPSVSYLYYKEQRISFMNLFRTIEILKKFKADIIHIQTPGFVGIVGCLAAKMTKTPLIGTYHTLVSELVKYFSLIKPDSIKLPEYKFLKQLIIFMSKNKYDTRKNIIKNLTISVYNMCNLVLVPSKSMIQELNKQNAKPKVKYISNGLDITNFQPKENYSSDKMKILHVGRLSHEKKVDVLLKSMIYVLKDYPNAILTIVGGGPAEHILKKLVVDLKIEKNVKFLGYIDRNNLPEIYASHDVFVTASTMETQGIVILEAMASGLPIVGVDKYAIPDIVLHEQNGFLAQPENSKEIAKYICKIIENEKLRKEFGKKSLEISASHDLPNVILEMERTYENLLNKNYSVPVPKSFTNISNFY